jgi:hypothetical protein
MQIIHKIDDFLFTIFPLVKKGDVTAPSQNFLHK